MSILKDKLRKKLIQENVDLGAFSFADNEAMKNLASSLYKDDVPKNVSMMVLYDKASDETFTAVYERVHEELDGEDLQVSVKYMLSLESSAKLTRFQNDQLEKDEDYISYEMIPSEFDLVIELGGTRFATWIFVERHFLNSI